MSIIEGIKTIMEERNSRMLGFSSAISAYGIAAIRGVFVLNGSAAVAVLAKQQNLSAEGKAIIWLCALGAVLAVICAGLSFIAQWYSKENFLNITAQQIFACQRSGTSWTFMNPPNSIHERVVLGFSIIAFCGSIFSFSFALYQAVNIL